MTADQVVFLLVVVVPLFAARWRVSLLGLALQGVLLWRVSGGGGVADAVDFLALRAVLAPALLWAAYAGAERNDVIPANLWGWVAVGGLVLGAREFSLALGVDAALQAHLLVGTAALLLGFFVLASQDNVFSQIVGIVRIENAVAFLELGFGREHDALLVRAAEGMATAGSAVIAAWYLRQLRGFTPPTSGEPR